MNVLLLLTLAMLWATIPRTADPLKTAQALAESADRAQSDIPEAERISTRMVDAEAGFYYLPKQVLATGDHVVKLLESKGLGYHWQDRGQVVSHIRELKNLIRQSGAGDDASFEDVAAGLEPRVSVSSLGVSASASQIMIGYVRQRY
jgi:hypothetical protein